MRIKLWLKSKPLVYNTILYFLNRINYFNLRFRFFFPAYKLPEFWSHRISRVKECPENMKIDRIKDAGNIFNNYQLMHNGLKIGLGSYYDYGNTILIRENKGVHEPEEESAFQQIIDQIPANGCIIELGSYWAFYSMWFAMKIPNASCYMIEPDPHKMNFGKINFKLNGLNGKFILGYIDNKSDLKKPIPTFSVDYLVNKHDIDQIDILHSDIQGFEFRMLTGATRLLTDQRIRHLFISTHSNELHYSCIQLLESKNYLIDVSIDLDKTYSWDGLIVATRPK